MRALQLESVLFMSIGLLYERSETDELGIKLTAEELGIELQFIPFRKVAATISRNQFFFRSKGKDYTDIIKDVGVVLNRAQSKNRRLQAAYLMESIGKKVLNTSSVEFVCYSKLRVLLDLWRQGLPIPKTVYVPCDPHDSLRNGKEIHNEEDIADLLQQEITSSGIVIKPDAGTHGKMITLSVDRDALVNEIRKAKPSIINPVGVLAQEFIRKWFYDLRIIVFKEKKKSPECHPIALARGGLIDFRTNTYLGNLVFAAHLPLQTRELAVKCGEAVCHACDAWVIALDAMVDYGENAPTDNEYLNSMLNRAALEFNSVKKVKMDELKLRDFQSWNKKLEEAFQTYTRSEPYLTVKSIIEESLEKNVGRIVFHEANSCPEFWEQTRLIAGVNVAVPLLKCAQSLV